MNSAGKNTFFSLTNLVELNASHNLLIDLPDLGPLGQLARLNLGFNRLASLPESICTESHRLLLAELDAQNNEVGRMFFIKITSDHVDPIRDRPTHTAAIIESVHESHRFNSRLIRRVSEAEGSESHTESTEGQTPGQDAW